MVNRFLNRVRTESTMTFAGENAREKKGWPVHGYLNGHWQITDIGVLLS